MLRTLALGLLLVGLSLLPAQEPVQNRDAPPFTLPPGFIAEKVAAPPLVQHPVMAGFDDQGRLFVAENAGTNLRADDLLKNPVSTLRRLVDPDGDGRFNAAEIFADRFTFPQGALWHRGSLYTCSPPSLWKLDDPGSTGRVQTRTELVSKFGFNGNAADIHGPFLGPEGRLYWCDGRHGHDITTREGTHLKGKAARIFRCRPDGRDVEVVCGGGMDNPVELVFTDEGEPIASVDLFQAQPARMDVLIHAIEGGVFPYYQPVLGEFQTTGPLLPPVVELGWVAPAGLARYRGTALGADYRGNLFLCQFNTHKVVRVILERKGASFAAKVEDFLTSTDPNFHPTDVLEDADGSLLVIDTGGWFRIGCPTSQVAKPDLLGSIWRIRKADAARVDDPRGNKLAWKEAEPAELCRRLSDARPVVRDRAIQALRDRGEAAIPALTRILEGHRDEAVRRDAVWTLAGIESERAREVIRPALGDDSPSVRQVAARVLGLERDRAARRPLEEMVRKGTPPERREAATALGRLGLHLSVPALLTSLATAEDRFLEHALIYALMQIKAIEPTRAGLEHALPRVRKAALLALDRIDPTGLSRDDVFNGVGDPDPDLRAVALDLATTRPDWAGDLVAWGERAFFDERVTVDSLRAMVARLSGSPPMQELIARLLRDDRLTLPRQRMLLEEIARLTLPTTPATWAAGLNHLLENGPAVLRWQTITTIRARNLAGCDDLLRKIARDAQTEAELRTLALATLGPRATALDSEAFDFLRSRLDGKRPPLERLAAAQALGSQPLSDAQRQALCADIARLGPLELPPLLAGFEAARDEPTGRQLLAALEKSPGFAAVTARRLTKTLANFPPEIRTLAEPLFQRLQADHREQLAHLADLEKKLPAGDIPRGRSVFHGTRAICAACHVVAGQGRAIGPDLTRIGTIRTERDLLEAILLPSVSIVRGYETFQVELRDGRQLVGLLANETHDAITLVNAERTEIRLARSQVESIEPTRTSLMPAGLDKQLTPQEIADLLAYLRSLK